MIELIIVVLVVRMFTKKASEKGLNKVVWGIIGALSYYVPVLLVGFLLLPSLIESGTLDFSSVGTAVAVSLLITLGTGVLCCVGAYRILLSQNSIVKQNESVIDSTFE